MLSKIFNKKNWSFIKLIMSLVLTMVFLIGVSGFILSPLAIPKWLVLIQMFCLMMQCLMLPDYVRNYLNLKRQEEE